MSQPNAPGDTRFVLIMRELDEVAAHAAARSDIARLAVALRTTVEAIVAAAADGSAGSRPVVMIETLTRAQRRTADLVRQGFTNQQVATRLHVTPNTVNYHLRQIYRKLGISSRVQLAAAPWPDVA